jgi:peptide/nickel transport system ATP-binding protein
MVALLDIERVTKIFSGRMGVTRAVHDLSMVLDEKPKLVSVAGESGSGKSTLALMVLGFLKPTSGAIRYKGLDIHASGAVGAETFRREVQAVFQNPFEAFNPFYKIDHAFNLVIQKFRLARAKGERLDLVHGVLRTVQLEPGKILGRYPHEMSGGQLQRVSIARALLAKPKLLVADEPVSMIDASLRLRVLRHLVTLKEKYGVSIIYITHDLSTALQISDEVLIMHRGEVVERGDAVSVIQTPQHPYTKLLVESIPVADPSVKWVGVSKKYELLLETELTLIR